MDRLLGSLTRHPGWVVLVILAITGFFASRIVDFETGRVFLRVDASTKTLLPEGEESQEFYERIQRQFGLQESLLLVLVMEDVFTPDALERIKAVTERVAEVKGVERVFSLANAPNVRATDADIEILPFLETLPSDLQSAEQIRADLERNPIYAGRLVSGDARATALVVQLEDIPEQEFIDLAIDAKIAEAAREAGGGVEVLLTGPAHIKAESSRLIVASLARILPLSFAIMAGIGLLAFGSIRGVVVPLGTVVIALIWTLGLVAWAGVSLNLVTTITPPLLMTIGFAYVVHVVSDYYRALGEDSKRLQASGGPAAWALRHVALPVALTGLTTAIGFLALTLSAFPAVREFGWISLLGVTILVVLSLSFSPAALALFGTPRRHGSRTGAAGLWFDEQLERLGRFDVEHRTPVLLASGLIAGLSVLGMTRIQVNTDLISNFRPDHPVRLDFDAINRSLGGSMPFEVVIEASEREALVEPANLQALEALQTWLDEQPEVGGTTSLVDHVKLLNRSFHGGDDRFLVIPANTRLTRQLLLFGSSKALDQIVDRRYQTTRLEVRSRAPDSKDIADLADRIEARLAALPASLEARVSGSPVLLARSIDAVAEGQIATLTFAFVFIYVVLAVLFTSLRVGLVALLPNALPVLVYFGVLGFSGISLNTTTGLFACIILGIAVDDTIHFLTRFEKTARACVDEKNGAVEALRSIGRPVTITTVALCLGLLALTTSELKGQVEFGMLGAFILAVAWVFDMIFTPALCAGVRIVTLWDALTYDLGEDPQQSIPVLRGMSNAQARIAALMTRVDTIPAGAAVFRAGEPGDELLVVLDGEMVASVERDGHRIELSRATRGSIVGELALFEGKRTADVDAVSDVQVLRLNKENLMRLRNRYPRIAARLFWNLSEIVAGRVTHLTGRLA